MTDGLVNCEVIKYFAAEKAAEKNVSEFLISTEDQWVRFYRQSAVNGLIVATIYAGFLTAAALLAANDVHHDGMTIGTFVLINSYMLQLVQPVETMGFAIQSILQGIAYLENMLAVFRQRPEDLISGETMTEERPATLEFENVGVSYQGERSILKGVCFRLPAGKTLGIVGSSGAGKSTLVRLLTRLLEPDAGTILIDGVPASAMNLRKLRELIAVVPQDTILFDDTIAYNIGFGREGSSQAEIEQAARLARLHDFIVTLPNGYQTLVGERGVKLSGGEKQRVSIARAAIKRPRIYVFDEATSSLDSRTEQEISRNLQELSRARTTVIIAHRLSSVIHADEIVVLDRGVIVERGTHNSLLERKRCYAELWEAQQSGSGGAALIQASYLPGSPGPAGSH